MILDSAVRRAQAAPCVLIRACVVLAVTPAVAMAMPPLRIAQLPDQGQLARPLDTLPIGISDVYRLTVRQAPQFLAVREEIGRAQGRLRQSRALAANPEVAVEPEFAESQPGVTARPGWRGSVSQPIEWAGQRGLRIAASDRDLARARLAVRDAARVSLATASLAFYDALAASRRLAVAAEIVTLYERLRAATRVQLAEGEISTLDANLVEIEWGRARARLLAARRLAWTAELELKRQLGVPAARPITLADDSTVGEQPAGLDTLLAVALSRRPDMTARTVAIEEARLLSRLAGREAIPPLRLGLFAVGGSGSIRPRVGVGVGFPLPVWNRNRGLVAERDAELRQAGLLREAAELRVRTEVADAYRAFITAREEAELFEREVLRPARTNQALLEDAYRAGKLGVATLVLLRNQLLDAELAYWDAWLARRTAQIRLQEATAELVPTHQSLDSLTSWRLEP